MQIETAKVSLLGDREENQDRIGILRRGGTVLAIVMDGMGGHAQGEVAAQVGLDKMLKLFADTELPINTPEEFLSQSLLQAHEDVIKAGHDMPVDMMPRATTAICLIQGEQMYWLHVGDSRLYHIRDAKIVKRTRDHTHVETLLQQGVITESQINTHPMRNYVDSCLGGEIDIAEISKTGAMDVEAGDVIMLCSDGVWSAFQDNALARFLGESDEDIETQTQSLCDLAVQRCHPYSDNSSAIILRLS